MREPERVPVEDHQQLCTCGHRRYLHPFVSPTNCFWWRQDSTGRARYCECREFRRDHLMEAVLDAVEAVGKGEA